MTQGFDHVADPELRRQVRQRLLRPVPRRRREPASVRRPQPVPDGPGQRARGAARGRARCRRRRRHAHGQARAALSRHPQRACARTLRRCPMAAYQVSGEYAMLHAAAANGWIDLQRVRAGKPDQHQARRRRHDPDLLRQRRRALAGRSRVMATPEQRRQRQRAAFCAPAAARRPTARRSG